jgi:hypothetical protein
MACGRNNGMPFKAGNPSSLFEKRSSMRLSMSLGLGHAFEDFSVRII